MCAGMGALGDTLTQYELMTSRAVSLHLCLLLLPIMAVHL